MQNSGLHHLHARKRLYKHLEPFPHPVRWKRLLDYFMYGIAVAAPLALLPQAWAVHSTQQVEGFSLPTWVLLGVMNLMWVMYGLVHRAPQISLANTLFAVFNFSIALGVLLYR